MKRQKEIKNLICNVQQSICDNCKRWDGEFYQKKYPNSRYSTDMYNCKYNTDNKGLHSGTCINFPQNYKCKYFKRNSKHITCKFNSKHYSSYQSGVKIKEVKWVRGKFKNMMRIKNKN